MPDDADAPVARCPAGRSAGPVAIARVALCLGLLLQLGRAQRFGDGRLHSVELVIPGHLLDQNAAAVVLEHQEVADERQQPARGTDALDYHLELR